MKRIFSSIVIILAATLTLESCEKDEILIHYEQDAPAPEPEPEGQPADDPEPKSDPAPEPQPEPEPTDNVLVFVTGPVGVTVTSVILNKQVTAVSVPLVSGPVEVFSWYQESVSGSIVLSLEYEDTDGTPRRFTFAPTDDDWLPVLKDHIASGTVTVFTVNLYTSSVTAE